MRDFYSPKGHETIGDSDLLSKAKAVPRLKNDLVALSILLAGDVPYRVPARIRKNGWVGYGMGDTSGDGFGSAFYIDGVMFFRYGQ